MKRQIPPDLTSAFVVSFVLALLLFVVQCALVVALAVHYVLWHFKSPAFDAEYLGWTLAALGLNGYALSRAFKARHLLGLFSAWPGLPEEGATDNETRLLALSARQAFLHGDFAKTQGLLKRLALSTGPIELARGRSLVMQGEFEEAVTYLESGGQGWAARRFLTRRRNWWLLKSRYFQPSDVHWATRTWRLTFLGALALAASLTMLAFNYQLVDSIKQTVREGFSDKNFNVSVQGRFTLHYHDEAFMRQVADQADDALTQDLAFLGLPPEAFGPGEIQLYLCADQAEYLARSPFTRSWEAASALPSKTQIYFYNLGERQRIYFEVVVAHELAHLCYHKVVTKAEDDSWLNEGLADYLGYKFALDRAHYPRQAWLLANHFNKLKEKSLPFDIFLSDDPHHLKDEDSIHTFYTQGFSIVYVLIEEYGKDDFLRFLRYFGAGKPLAASLQAAYPTIRNATELQAVWTLFMR